jgi:hypothetical protein
MAARYIVSIDRLNQILRMPEFAAPLLKVTKCSVIVAVDTKRCDKAKKAEHPSTIREIHKNNLGLYFSSEIIDDFPPSFLAE